MGNAQEKKWRKLKKKKEKGIYIEGLCRRPEANGNLIQVQPDHPGTRGSARNQQPWGNLVSGTDWKETSPESKVKPQGSYKVALEPNNPSDLLFIFSWLHRGPLVRCLGHEAPHLSRSSQVGWQTPALWAEHLDRPWGSRVNVRQSLGIWRLSTRPSRATSEQVGGMREVLRGGTQPHAIRPHWATMAPGRHKRPGLIRSDFSLTSPWLSLDKVSLI